MENETKLTGESANNAKVNVSGSNFSMWTMQSVDNKNSGYKHIIEDKTLYITKDGVTMKLIDDEVMQVLKAIGIDTSYFRRGFKWEV